MISQLLLVIHLVMVIGDDFDNLQQTHETTHQHYGNLHYRYQTIVAWLYDDTAPTYAESDKFYETIPKKFSQYNNGQTIFLRSSFAHFKQQKLAYFKNPGLYITINKMIHYYPDTFLNENFVNWLKVAQTINDDFVPSVQSEDELSSQLKRADTTTMVLIISKDYWLATKLLPIYKQALENAVFHGLGINSFLWLDSSEYEGYKQPVILLKHQDQPLRSYNRKLMNLDGVSTFILTETRPLIQEFSADIFSQIYQKSQKFLIILLLDENVDNSQHLKELQELAQQQHQLAKIVFNRIIFLYSYYNDQSKWFWKKFNINEQSQTPQLFGVEFDKTTYFVKKYFSNGIKPMEFCEKIVAQTLQPYLLTQQVSDIIQPGNGFQEIVGENFKEVVIDSPQHVLVLGYSGSTKFSLEEFEKIILSTREDLSYKDDLLLTRIDIEQNEILEFSVTQSPAIMVFTKQEYENQNRFNLPLSEETFSSWMKELLTPSLGNTLINQIEEEDELLPPQSSNRESTHSEVTDL